MLLPGATPGQTQRRMIDGDVSIVANRPEVQAISQRSTGVILANFFAASDTSLVTASAASSVAIADAPDIGGEIAVAIADPSRRVGDPVRVTFPQLSGLRLLDAADTITVVSTEPLTLECATQGTHGAAQEARFARPASR